MIKEAILVIIILHKVIVKEAILIIFIILHKVMVKDDILIINKLILKEATLTFK